MLAVTLLPTMTTATAPAYVGCLGFAAVGFRYLVRTALSGAAYGTAAAAAAPAPVPAAARPAPSTQAAWSRPHPARVADTAATPAPRALRRVIGTIADHAKHPGVRQSA